MANHVLSVLKNYVVHTLAAGWRTGRALAGDAPAVLAHVTATTSAPLANGRPDVALLIATAPVSERGVGGTYGGSGVAPTALAADIDALQLRCLVDPDPLVGELLSPPGRAGNVIVIPQGVIEWEEVRQRLLVTAGQGMHDVGDVPLVAEYVAVPAGPFCRVLFFALLRLQGVMGLPLLAAPVGEVTGAQLSGGSVDT